MRKRAMLCGAAFGLSASVLHAAPIVYTDTAGDQVGSTNKARDIQSVTIDNDTVNFIITINLDPGATLGTVTFDYGIGITTGSPTAGGDTVANAVTHGNPYTRTLSIDSSKGGMMDWIGLFPAGGAGTVASPWTSYGFNDYVFGTPGSLEAPGVWKKVETVNSGMPMAVQGANTGLSSITVTVPMADFGSNLPMLIGTTFLFDVYSTGASANTTAYDSLADPLPTNGTNSGTTQYNGTALYSYTVVPEPGLLGLASLAGSALLKRRPKG